MLSHAQTRLHQPHRVAPALSSTGPVDMRSSLASSLRAGLCWTNRHLATAGPYCPAPSTILLALSSQPMSRSLACSATGGSNSRTPGLKRSSPRPPARVTPTTNRPLPLKKQQPAKPEPATQSAPQPQQPPSQQRPMDVHQGQPQQINSPQQDLAAPAPAPWDTQPPTARQRMVRDLIAARKQLMQYAPFTQLPIVGVTFEGRQEHVQKLVADQAVYVIKEPTNAYDPNARRVEHLGGVSLGYIQRDLTMLFPLEYTFGYVLSMGQTSSGVWGVTNKLFPTLQSLTLDPLPEPLASAARLEQALPPTQWEALRSRVMDRADGRCQITGVVPTPGMALEVVPVWRYAFAQHRVKLVDCFAAAAPVAKATKLLELESEQDKKECVELLMAMQRWRPEDFDMYLIFVCGRQEAIRRDIEEGVDWQVDLSWTVPGSDGGSSEGSA